VGIWPDRPVPGPEPGPQHAGQHGLFRRMAPRGGHRGERGWSRL